MTHVINKMRQLGIGLGDFMALFRAWLKFSSAAVNLLVEGLVEMARTRSKNAAK